VRAARTQRGSRLALLTLLWVVLALLLPPLAAMRAWQSQFVFKCATGGVLLAYLAFQWQLAAARARGASKAGKRLFAWHRSLGAAGPVLLYVHAATRGFGYLTLLCGVFLANHLLGVLHPGAGKARKLLTPWMVSHVAASVLLIALAGYHAWNALYYE
jgi:hypothetical protein